jgi:hypothetical protein
LINVADRLHGYLHDIGGARLIDGWEDMTDMERRDLLWGLRDGSATHMNRVRLEMFEAVKGLLRDKRQYPSMIEPAPESNMVDLNDFSAPQQLAPRHFGPVFRLGMLANGWWP